VIVINQGEIVADDRVNNLLKLQGKANVVVEFADEVSEEALSMLAGVEKVTRLEKGLYRLIAKEGADLRPEVFHFASEQKLSLIGLKQEENTLEDIFRSLTVKETVS
jgi:ABC-2 type transport system ATP-binding protein